jgi:hypothetical protein
MDFTCKWPVESGYYWFVDTDHPNPEIAFIQRDVLYYGDQQYRKSHCEPGRRGIRIGDQIKRPHLSQIRINDASHS